MSGLEPIINVALVNLINNPPLLSIFIGTLIGLFYYFGSIINANNWQYNNVEKHGNIFHGFYFMTFFVFFPIIILYVINLFFDVASFLQKFPLWFYFLILIVLLSCLELLDKWIYTKLRNFDDPTYPALGVWFARSGEWKYLFYLLNYGILVMTKDSVLIFAMIVFDFLIITKFARLSNLNHQGAKAEIKTIDSNELKTVRLIEFIEKGTFLKVQDQETKKGIAIPTSRIEYLNLINDETTKTNIIEALGKMANMKDTNKK